MDNYSLIWFIAGIILLFAELIMPGFIIFFFGIGSLVTALLTYLFNIESVIIQLMIFLVTSLLSLALLRKYFGKLFKGKTGSDKILKDEFIGKRAVVIKEIKPNSLKGKIEFNGTHWEADSEIHIEKDTVVEITERRDLTLIVKPVE
ncbi:MAG TPA: NfeD family protein [Ignavibacteria bacterium]|nr:NfeD family protein [Ignavibacteria bacterium]